MTRSLDFVVLSLAFALAFVVRFDGDIPVEHLTKGIFLWPYVVGLQYASLLAFGITNCAWRYIGLREVVRILAAMTVASCVFLSFRLFLAEWLVSSAYVDHLRIAVGVIIIDLALAFLGIVGVRVLRRISFEHQRTRRRTHSKSTQDVLTLLVGAGEAGLSVAREVGKRPDLGLRLLGFVDDDAAKTGEVVHGLPVLGRTADIGAIAKRNKAEQAIITVANLGGEEVRRIRSHCETAGLSTRIIPSLSEILDGRVSLGRTREVSIEDLLRRPVVDLETERLEQFLRGRRVLVTGAGGSIGSEISRQVARFGPELLVLLERSEPQLFAIHSELSRERTEWIPSLTDLCDAVGVESVLSAFEPQIVLHAAAHKHVPMLECNVAEAVKNNVLGTKNLVDAAHRHGVETFVMLSTDKAVNPTSIMGATKRTAELLLQAKSQRSPTRYVSVRFGNVLGSTGSVVPIFKRQIVAGGPVTVTHPEMRRYFMTVSEATQLVLVAGTLGKGGEVFVLDMGDPVKILDLAIDLIKLSGFEPGHDIPIEFSGVRPGEKLFEELGFDPNRMGRTVHPKIFVLKQDPVVLSTMSYRISALAASARDRASSGRLRRLLESIVPEMRPASPIGANRAEKEPYLAS